MKPSKEMMEADDNRAEWRHYIVSTPEILSGKPRITNTRIPVALILGYLASGGTAAEIIREFPDLEPEHISACLAYARDLVAVRN